MYKYSYSCTQDSRQACVDDIVLTTILHILLKPYGATTHLNCFEQNMIWWRNKGFSIVNTPAILGPGWTDAMCVHHLVRV